MKIEILDEEIFVCPVCKKYFTTFYGLVTHFRMSAHGYCPICKKTYKNVIGHFYQKSFSSIEHAILFGLSPTKQGKTGDSKKKYRQYKEICKKLAYEKCKRRRVQLVLDGKRYDVLEAIIQNGKIVLHCYKRHAYEHLGHHYFEIEPSNEILNELRKAGVDVYVDI